MAEEAVTSVLEKLAAVLLQQVQEGHALRGQIKQVEKELRLIQALLRDVDSKCNRNNLVTEWLNQVREIANRIATVIDTLRDKIEENRAESSNWVVGKLTMADRRNYKAYLLRLRYELENIIGIIVALNRLYQRLTDLRIDDLGAHDDVDDPEVVGLEDDQRKIIEQLLDSSISRRTVLSIVGTGGLGKTTLAEKVYKRLKGQFACCTWLPISQKFNSNDLLRKILYSIKPEMKDKNRQVTDNDLPVELKSSLSSRRYLIVLDDVWSIDLWELLRTALPDTNNASRVIITTRLIDVAKAADCNTEPYKLRYLDDSESLALLFRKAFQQPIQPENYPLDLLEVAKRLTKKCGGLPLALDVLGGILSRRNRNYITWRKMEETMDWQDEDGKKCSQVLAMSYENLPYELKPCFLYFAAFPENYVFSGKHVTKMWVAEGFIPEDGFATMEDRAEAYLEELVQRCLIDVTEKSWNGCCKYGTMHILLRDLAIREAKEKNFFTVFSKAEEYDKQLAERKPRRAALQFCTPSDDGVLENTRSLLYFGENSSNDSGFRLLNYSCFGLLRVLTIEHVDMRNSAGLVGLIHLRYLGFRYCTFRQEIFVKISFYNLETIDLKGSSIEGETTHWSDVIIPNLRHVYGYKKLERIFPLKLDHHTNLQTLKSVGQGQVHSLQCCTNLRTLGISYTKDNERTWCPLTEWQTLKGVLESTEQLVSLSIEVTLGGGCLVPFGSTEDLPCHEKIQSLQLCGKWGIGHQYPRVEMFPTYLTKLTLEESSLQKDPMPIFERLQSLRTLRLGPYSYEGTELICSTGGFPNLEKLELKVLPKLRHWDIKEGAMPILSHLKIDQCDELHALPELQKVQTLQELTVYEPSRELWEGMQIQGKDVHKIEHIPSVRISELSSSLKRQLEKMQVEDTT